MLPASHSAHAGWRAHRQAHTCRLSKVAYDRTQYYGVLNPGRTTAGEATTSGRFGAVERLVTSAAGDSPGYSGRQVPEFRDFQQQATAAARQELAARQGRGTQRSRQPPYRKSYWGQLPQGWFAKPDYTAASLYEEIVKKCEANTCGPGVLFMICKLANNPQEARIVLNAFAAVRASLVRQGNFKPYSERLAVAFVHMIRDADAPDVLLEALRRASELGLLLSRTRLHEIMRHWGEQGDLAKIEEVLGSMPLGGVPYNHVTAYIVIRTAVNLGAQDKAEYYAAAMQQRQIRLTDTTVRLLELGRERQRQRERAQQQQQQQAAASAAALSGRRAK